MRKHIKQNIILGLRFFSIYFFFVILFFILLSMANFLLYTFHYQTMTSVYLFMFLTQTIAIFFALQYVKKASGKEKILLVSGQLPFLVLGILLLFQV